ncbi:hypothetical protein ASE07_22575 [Noviherbaspirillum sp. Root189]|nr:hypothetical protein ASE07_22575 [Noviherbaspirillum sp. Root189]
MQLRLYANVGMWLEEGLWFLTGVRHVIFGKSSGWIDISSGGGVLKFSVKDAPITWQTQL